MVYITSDSTCDIGKYAKERNVPIMPLTVILGANSFSDGVDITPQAIFRFVEEKGILPKTAAANREDYERFFRQYTQKGDSVVHINISAKASSSHENALEAAKLFQGKVKVVDSKALSGGQGLLVMLAADLRERGLSAEEIVSELEAAIPNVNTSFVPDRLDYLYKGGRCSKMALYGANLLRIHPLIKMVDGQLMADKRYHGSMKKCISGYIDDLAALYPEYDDTRCFITHSSADAELVEFAKEKTKERFSFREIVETVAGSIVTSHCGRNTLGLLFIARERK